ncbi:MAG: hypothetical protein HYS98_07520 [Deltaproteobacteria bacterium]|nr:hypothetical protein [Deltaproteobacteria bacterium]
MINRNIDPSAVASGRRGGARQMRTSKILRNIEFFFSTPLDNLHLLRFLCIEKGLLARKIAKNIFFKNYSREYQRRHVFHFHCTQNLPETCVHKVQAGGEDSGLLFKFTWQSLHDLNPKILLIQGVGNSLKELERSCNYLSFRQEQ